MSLASRVSDFLCLAKEHPKVVIWIKGSHNEFELEQKKTIQGQKYFTLNPVTDIHIKRIGKQSGVDYLPTPQSLQQYQQGCFQPLGPISLTDQSVDRALHIKFREKCRELEGRTPSKQPI